MTSVYEGVEGGWLEIFLWRRSGEKAADHQCFTGDREERGGWKWLGLVGFGKSVASRLALLQQRTSVLYCMAAGNMRGLRRMQSWPRWSGFWVLTDRVSGCGGPSPHDKEQARYLAQHGWSRDAVPGGSRLSLHHSERGSRAGLITLRSGSGCRSRRRVSAWRSWWVGCWVSTSD